MSKPKISYNWMSRAHIEMMMKVLQMTCKRLGGLGALNTDSEWDALKCQKSEISIPNEYFLILADGPWDNIKK